MTIAAVVLIVSVIVFAIFGVPLVWALVLGCICSVTAGGTLESLPILAQRMFAGGLQYSMLAIFFFVLAGAIMQYGGLSRRLVSFANSLVGHISGGASLVCVMACAFFAAISGSAVATTAAIGGIMYPELRRLGIRTIMRRPFRRQRGYWESLSLPACSLSFTEISQGRLRESF